MSVNFNRYQAQADDGIRECEHCKRAIVVGQFFFYFHQEEPDFDSVACLQAYYRDDAEAQDMSRRGYRPFGLDGPEILPSTGDPCIICGAYGSHDAGCGAL